MSLYYVGQKGDKNAETIARDKAIKLYTIRAGKFRRFHTLSLLRQIFNFGPNLLNVRDAFYTIIGFFQSIFLLLKIKPDVIFFKGGYVVVPLGKAARLLRIPYITHDSDALPGLANRLIAKGATYNAVAHSAVTYYPKKKTVVTGIPVVQEYIERSAVAQSEYKKRLGLPKDSVHLFVYTGTQGARVIDDVLNMVVPELLEKHSNLYISHVFGRLNEHMIEERYRNVPNGSQGRIRKLAFIENAYDYVASADIIIGRAGATSMAEFATIGRACVIIPAEQLTGGHQLKNVEPLESAGVVRVVRESDLQKRLEAELDRLIVNEDERHELEGAFRKFAVADASLRIAQLIIDTYNKEQLVHA